MGTGASSQWESNGHQRASARWTRGASARLERALRALGCRVEQQEGNGPGDGVRLRTRGTLRGVERRWEGDGRPGPPRWVGSPETRNATNLMVGSGMQQAREPWMEKAVEVVRNHMDGTSGHAWRRDCRMDAPSGAAREWTSNGGTAERRPRESRERQEITVPSGASQAISGRATSALKTR